MFRTQTAKPASRSGSRALIQITQVPAALRSRVLPEAERTDLPALERVTEQVWVALPFYAMLGLAPVALLGGLYVYRGVLEDLLRSGEGALRTGLSLGIGGLGVLVLLAWLVVRLARGDCAWKTDSAGIEARGLFRHRRLRWTEVTAATSTGFDSYHLDGPCGRLSFTSTRVAGSVWQHLRRHDRHRSFHLCRAAASFWAEYPSTDLPLTWVNPGRRPAITLDPTASFLSIWVWADLLALTFMAMNGWGAAETVLTVLMLAGAALVARRGWQASQSCIRRCEVTAEGLHGETWRGPFQLRWDEIEWVRWGVADQQREELRLGGGSPPQELFLPISPARPEAIPILYSMFHRLRYADPPLALPLPFWLQEPTGDQDAAAGQSDA